MLHITDRRLHAESGEVLESFLTTELTDDETALLSMLVIVDAKVEHFLADGA